MPPRSEPAADTPATVAASATVAPERTLALPSGRQVTLFAGAREELVIHDPEGRVEVSILLTPQGPLVTVAAARLHVAVADEIALECRRFALEASEGISLRTDGTLHQRAGGDHVVEAGGAVVTSGESAEVAVREGVRITGRTLSLRSSEGGGE